MPVLTPADLTTLAGAAVLISILVQVWKNVAQPTVAFMQRFGEVIAIGLGIVIVELGSLATGADLIQGVLTGLFAGLSSIGLYHVTNAVAPNVAKSTGS